MCARAHFYSWRSCAYGRIVCAVKHTHRVKPVTLIEARGRVPGLTQLQLEIESGVDRTRISKLESEDDPRLLHHTYEKLDGALRRCGALKPGEKLVFGQREAVAS